MATRIQCSSNLDRSSIAGETAMRRAARMYRQGRTLNWIRVIVSDWTNNWTKARFPLSGSIDERRVVHSRTKRAGQVEAWLMLDSEGSPATMRANGPEWM